MRTPKIIQSRESLAPYLLLLLIIPLFLNISFGLSERLFYVVSGVLFGYVLQRHKFCFTAGLRDVFLLKNTTLTRAILLLLGVSIIFFSLLINISAKDYSLLIQPIGPHNILGGILFGIGMVIAGGCATGVLMRVGEGYQMQILALLGMLLGSLVGAYHYSLWIEQIVINYPIINIQDYFGRSNALLLQILLLILLYLLCLYVEQGKKIFSLQGIKKQLKGNRTKNRYFKGALYISIINIIFLYVITSPISITAGLTYFSGGLFQVVGVPVENISYFTNSEILLANPLIIFVFSIIVGSFLSSFIHREFRYRKVRSKKYLFMGITGGFLMGYSARIAMGCNFGGFINAIASMSFHGWVLGAAILLGTYIGSKILAKIVM